MKDDEALLNFYKICNCNPIRISYIANRIFFFVFISFNRSLKHPQRYKKQNIACDWAVFPNLDKKKYESCPFYCNLPHMVSWKCQFRIWT